MSILQKYDNGYHYFILKIHNMCASFLFLDEGMRLLRENNINVGCPIPDDLVVELYYTGKAYIEDREKHLGHLNDRLLIAARKGDIKTVEQLIERGAKINDDDHTDSMKAFIAVAQDGRIKFDEQLNEKLAKMINHVGNTALLMAAYNGHIEIVKLLIEKGVNINAKNIYDWTALDCAQKKGHKNIVDWLKENGGKSGGAILLSPTDCLFPE